jgi:N-acetylneuraminate lyase
MLSEDERKNVMEAVKSFAPDKTLIAHIGSIDERVAKNLSAFAESLGYDDISSVAPFYYRFSFDEIKNCYLLRIDVFRS